ncbi:RCC1 domain-containing protein [Nannocystis pusilla]|uniref:RCC1 domain-containing protein n=1 Tax=Nannocystis pusilla TaxID=889268 RepID=UPI003DA41A13
MVTAALTGCGPAWWGRAPVEVGDEPGLTELVVEELAAGSFHTCARLRGGQVRCWGAGASGQLGDGMMARRERPGVVHGIDDAVQIAAEGDRTCAVRGDGSVWCWGRSPAVEVEAGAPSVRALPQPVAGWRDVRQLALGFDHDCAVVGSGRVMCGGEGSHGALGDGGLLSTGPVAVVRLESAAEVAVGYGFSCARTSVGEVLCWGWNEYGQCGDGSGRDHLTPSPVEGIAGARALTAGFDHACASLSDGTAVCWGGDTFGQRGDGGETTVGPPAPVLGLGAAERLSAGQYRTTALLADGTARGWGREWGPERLLWPDCGEPREYVTEATESPRRAPPEPYCAAPATLPVADANQVVVGQLHACALTDDGQVLCWGSNAYGGVGDGGDDERLQPTPVAW